ncbi:hypothetical protein M9H77_17373 [Catharanthus roseus]|uniref:Uncharacterized protein n=1 Tax=Catharanthus roseus TaxID=4058 RepID=A0ACC0B4D3_CATRO|nr:hypothetical protein M9H77_17373 [Catharanthus roseus]
MPVYHSWTCHREAVWGMNVRTNVSIVRETSSSRTRESKDVIIPKRSLVVCRIKEIRPLAHESGVSDVIDHIRECDDDVEEDDHFINDKVEWWSKDVDNEEEAAYESIDDSNA